MCIACPCLLLLIKLQLASRGVYSVDGGQVRQFAGHLRFSHTIISLAMLQDKSTTLLWLYQCLCSGDINQFCHEQFVELCLIPARDMYKSYDECIVYPCIRIVYQNEQRSMSKDVGRRYLLSCWWTPIAYSGCDMCIRSSILDLIAYLMWWWFKFHRTKVSDQCHHHLDAAMTETFKCSSTSSRSWTIFSAEGPKHVSESILQPTLPASNSPVHHSMASTTEI